MKKMGRDLDIIAVIVVACVAGALSATEPTSLVLREDQLLVTKQGELSKLDFVCQARVGDCSFQYLLLPPGWHSEGNSLVIPASDIHSIRSFFVQTKISEPTGDFMTRNIIIDFTNGQGTFSSTFKDSNIDSQQSISLTTTISQPTTSPQSALSLNSLNQFGETFLQANGIVASLPSISKLDQTIFQADPFSITKTIQEIVEFKQACSEKLPYLKEIVARINEHVEYNKGLLQEQERRIQNAQGDLATLQNQRSSILRELQTLNNKALLQSQVKALQIERQDSYSKYFSNNIIATRYQRLFKELLGNQAVAPEELINVKQQIEDDKKELEDLNQKMLELRILQSALQNRIKTNQKKVKDTEANPNNTAADPAKLQALEDNFKQFSALATEYKIKQQQASRKLEEAKKKLSQISGTYQELSARLKQIQQTLKANTQPLVTEQMKDIQDRIDILQRNTPKLNTQIAACESQLKEVQAASQPAAVVYLSNPDAVANTELSNSSAQAVNVLSSLNIDTLRKQESTQTGINIFSSNWIRKYGVPSTYSFVCASSGGLVTGNGVVLGVVSGQIRVQDENGNIYTLHIGVCSKLLGSSSSYAPSIGDVVDWNGRQLTSNIYNVYRAIFYSLK